MWLSKPEVLISPTVWQISLQFRRQTRGFRPRRARRKCQQVTITSNDNQKQRYGRQNEKYYTTGTTTDGVEIPTASPWFSTHVAKWLRQWPTTRNGNVAPKTENTYISGTMTDRWHIPTATANLGCSTMPSSKKLTPGDCDNYTDNRKSQCRRFGHQSSNLW